VECQGKLTQRVGLKGGQIVDMVYRIDPTCADCGPRDLFLGWQTLRFAPVAHHLCFKVAAIEGVVVIKDEPLPAPVAPKKVIVDTMGQANSLTGLLWASQFLRA
jgi:hypothetical protein